MCLQLLLWLLEFSSSLLVCALPTLGSVNSMDSEIPQDNWGSEQNQQYNWHSRQDTQQVEKPEAPLDGESQWPPYSTWYHVATVLSGWTPVEDWKAVDRSPDSTEKVL